VTKPITTRQFDDAIKKIVGEDEFKRLLECGYDRPDLCRHVSQDLFVTGNEWGKRAAFKLMRRLAKRIWKKDGTLGLVE
jgi:hypothetical protein